MCSAQLGMTLALQCCCELIVTVEKPLFMLLSFCDYNVNHKNWIGHVLEWFLNFC